MEEYRKKLEIRWADLDPNFHVLHSRYYDMGAYVRMCFLMEHGITAKSIHETGIGPILLREECVFRREIHFGDDVSIGIQIIKARQDASRWSIMHHLYKQENVLAAIITVDGAWIDLEKRKMAIPPEAFMHGLLEMPRSVDFQWIN